MRTQDFISRLREASAKRLVFTNSDGATIHGGYHLTELKAASFDTVDCGAQKNQWNETIVQLWVSEQEEENGEFMTAAKFLSIYDKVARLISVDVTAEIRFEYGDENFPPSHYHVEKLNENEAELRVQLRLPQTTCKARDRRQSGEGCCG
jgi:predicted ATPase